MLRRLVVADAVHPRGRSMRDRFLIVRTGKGIIMAKRPGEKGKSNGLSMEDAEAACPSVERNGFGPGPGDFVSKHSFAATGWAKVRGFDRLWTCEEPGARS